MSAEAAAEAIFKKFNGQYMFPESHAFAFGVTAYQASWLKYHYPLEFFVASSTSSRWASIIWKL